MGDVSTYTDKQILTLWETETDMNQRNIILKEIMNRKLFPTESMATWEHEAGLYPDLEDPLFIEKIMKKQEFIENRQKPMKEQQQRAMKERKKNKDTLCNSYEEFELTPVQRFISRFLSPQCPYQSALLYHGVGVGKTCAAITTAEEYLSVYPQDTVFIVAPRNIQPGFYRTIFDEKTLVISSSRTVANSAIGCTGNSYIQRAGVEYEVEKSVVIRRINQSINSRYKILGYIQFWRYIQEIINSVRKTDDEERTRQEQIKAIRNVFDGRLIIIDEAHNLRDSPDRKDADDVDSPGGEDDISEAKAGKRLTPELIKVLTHARGIKLMLLTGTPMYNSYREIIFLLNLLLINDKKARLSERDIFNIRGEFTENGPNLLGRVASAYLSFMRGDNPLTFPVRLSPRNAPILKEWPSNDPKNNPLSADKEDLRKKTLLNLPFVPVSYDEPELSIIQKIATDVIEETGLGITSLDEMLQSGNWLFPETAESSDPEYRIRDAGFNSVFNEKKEGVSIRYESKINPTWLTRGLLKKASPKSNFIVERIPNSKGVIFLYSRFIKSGALPLALALEANGYSPWRGQPLLTNADVAVSSQGGLQCALCDKRERTHGKQAHKFTPAKYAILTGQVGISPKNAEAIELARSKENIYGEKIKVIIGSQVASEGVDFRFIREIYVFDSWFHLNKMEQVLGRGIRTCSHSLLPEVERNCTIYLLVNTYRDSDMETADLYMYRDAMSKAIKIGRVSRVLKQHALDCNLNIHVNYIKDLEPIQKLEDSQRMVRGVDDPEEEFQMPISLNDTSYTSICDWTECPYTCAKPINFDSIIQSGKVDMSSYNEYAMRWREVQMKQILKHLFEGEEQPNILAGALEDAFKLAKIPKIAISILLSNIVENKSFRIQIHGQEGYIIYRNGYYLFQPIRLADVRIPLALRVADVPIGQDEYTPETFEYVQKSEEETTETGRVPAPAVGEPVPVKKAAPVIAVQSAIEYWNACVKWADDIRKKGAPNDTPPEVMEILKRRYTGELFKREFYVLTIISWMYQIIREDSVFSDEKKNLYLSQLADSFLELIWDESIQPVEQIRIYSDPKNRTDILKNVAFEQIINRDGVDAFRYVNPVSGGIEYMCGNEKCQQSVVKILETNKRDPLNILEANNETTGGIYGFVISKVKEGKFVLKTNDRPVPKGTVPEKGKECENNSTMSGHKVQLLEIRKILDSFGYPPFLLIESVLNEKEERAKPEAAKKKKGEGVDTDEKLLKDTRKFQNATRACTLKNIILRMLDKLEKLAGRKRYFYRPIAAVKTKHRLK